MSKTKRIASWIFCLLPIVITVGIAILLDSIIDNLPVFHLKIDVASAVIIVGALASLMVTRIQLSHLRQQKQTDTLLKAERDEHKQFLLRLDHELKNPLSAIKTSLALIGQQLDDFTTGREKDELGKTVHQINTQTERINRLIIDLRKLAELETYIIELYPVNIHSLLEQTVGDLHSNPKCKERKISLSLPSAPWQLPEITTDEDLLYLSISNLIDNALKYTQPHDTIEIRAYENGNYVFIEIADSGIGIPEAEIENVWGKLYRARNSRGIPGNGLGLSIVKTVIERLNGHCSIRSQEGIGTVFVLQLPK